MLRLVIDTNVLVSAAILPTSRIGSIFLFMRQGRFMPLYCAESLEELIRVLNRPRLRAKYNLRESDTRTILDLIILRGQSVEIMEHVSVCRDPKDDIFLSLALAGSADMLVSGDNDLLSLHPFRGIPVVTPSDFLAAMG